MAKNTTDLVAEVNTNLPDNTTGQITPAIMRTTLADIIQSSGNLLTPAVWTALQQLSGGATVPTQTFGDNTGNAASTAFVQAALSSGTGVRTVASIAALAALSVPVSGSVVSVTDLAQGGSFVWNPANLSMQVANNPGSGIYVAPASNPTGVSGAWIRQPYAATQGLTNINSTGHININALLSSPLVPDGVTSNVSMLDSLKLVLQGICPEMPIPVNIATGAPTVLSINATLFSGFPAAGSLANPATHYLKPNQAFFFQGGTLPPELSFNTLYYITSANLTATTFTFSAVNNYGFPATEGTPVTTTGSGSGVSIVLTGRDINLFIPPGAYFTGNFADPVPPLYLTPNGISRIRYWAYGAMFDGHLSLGADHNRSIGFDPATGTTVSTDLINTTPNELASPNLNGVIKLQTTANTSKYYVGQWIAIFGLDIQDTFGRLTSGPPNNHFHEFKQILAKDVLAVGNSPNSAPGNLVVEGPLKWSYLSTYPQLVPINSTLAAGGAAQIAGMYPSWDTKVEVRGARWVSRGLASLARDILFEDCVFQGYGNSPGGFGSFSVAQRCVARRCYFGFSGANPFMEIDKMIEYLEIDNCTANPQFSFLFPSTSLQTCIIKGQVGGQITGTPRQIRITESLLENIAIGPPIGLTDSCEIYNSRVTYFDMQQRSDSAQFVQVGNDMTLVPNWTFSNGTFTRLLQPFTGTGYTVGTTLNIATVTTGIITVGHGFNGPGIVGGTTITGFVSGTPGGVGVYTISVSQTVGSIGSPINVFTTIPGSQGMLWQIPGAKVFFTDAGDKFLYYQNMGSPFAILNTYMDAAGNFSFDTTLNAIPTRQTATTSTISVASPALVTGPTLPALTPVCLTTTGLLPTGVSYSTIYFVINPVTNTFWLSQSTGTGNPIQAAVTFDTTANTVIGQTLAANTAVTFTTTGTLPTPLVVGTAYYVFNPVGATYQLTTTAGVGPAIDLAGSPTPTTTSIVLITTTGTQSGVHTVYANPLMFRPHPCPRMTCIGNSGCNTITDQNGAFEEPLFSRVRRAFVGKQNPQNPTGFQTPNTRIWGNLTNMTVNVIQAVPSFTVVSGTYNSGTGAVSLTLNAPHGIQGNIVVVVAGITGTGSVASLNATVTTTGSTSGSTLTYTIASGLTLTITPGTGTVRISSTLTITSPGFTQPNLTLSNFAPVIDLTTAGKRVITNNATTTSAQLGSDSFAFYPDWLSGPLVWNWANVPTGAGAAALPNSPVVTFEMTTDQGITRFGNMMGAPGTPATASGNSVANTWYWIDSGIGQSYGVIP
jgi:hypothetical protein